MITRKHPHRRASIEAGSMADIAFLLLVFFLVATTLQAEFGILRLLPALADEEPSPVPERNILEVLINDAGELQVNGEVITVGDLRSTAVRFLSDPDDDEDLPAMWLVTAEECRLRLEQLEAAPGPGRDAALVQWRERLEATRHLGPYREPPATAMMLVRAGPNVPYALYVAVQNELQGAVVDLRDQLSRRHFGKALADLDMHDARDRGRLQALRRAVPMRIADGEEIVR